MNRWVMVVGVLATTERETGLPHDMNGNRVQSDGIRLLCTAMIARWCRTPQRIAKKNQKRSSPQFYATPRTISNTRFEIVCIFFLSYTGDTVVDGVGMYFNPDKGGVHLDLCSNNDVRLSCIPTVNVSFASPAGCDQYIGCL